MSLINHSSINTFNTLWDFWVFFMIQFQCCNNVLQQRAAPTRGATMSVIVITLLLLFKCVCACVCALQCVLREGLEEMKQFFLVNSSCRLPLNPALLVTGINIQVLKGTQTITDTHSHRFNRLSETVPLRRWSQEEQVTEA